MTHYKEINNVENILSKCTKNATANKIGFGLFGQNNCCLSKAYNELYEPVKELEVRDDDIWVVSNPKSGTTWLQETVWLIGNDCDFEGAKINLQERFPFLEDSMMKIPETSSSSTLSVDVVKRMKSPRFIRTHLPWNLLPNQILNGEKHPKILYITRNPFDVIVSRFHHAHTAGYNGTLDDKVNQFINDQELYAPFWTHVEEYWEQRDKPNVLFLTYESMKNDLQNVIIKVANFLNKSVTVSSAENLEKLLKHLSFESMKSNSALNREEEMKSMAKLHGRGNNYANYIRKGEVGGWKVEMSDDSKKKMNDWVEKNKIPGIWDNIQGIK